MVEVTISATFYNRKRQPKLIGVWELQKFLMRSLMKCVRYSFTDALLSQNEENKKESNGTAAGWKFKHKIYIAFAWNQLL